jgi:hypothetical protein
MLISQEATSRREERQGCRETSLAELRRHLASPSASNSEHRQRLMECVRRLAQVRALGNEYARVELSPHAQAAVQGTAVA